MDTLWDSAHHRTCPSSWDVPLGCTDLHPCPPLWPEVETHPAPEARNTLFTPSGALFHPLFNPSPLPRSSSLTSSEGCPGPRTGPCPGVPSVFHCTTLHLIPHLLVFIHPKYYKRKDLFRLTLGPWHLLGNRRLLNVCGMNVLLIWSAEDAQLCRNHPQHFSGITVNRNHKLTQEKLICMLFGHYMLAIMLKSPESPLAILPVF